MVEVSKLTPSYGGISYERLEELGFLHWPCPAPDHPGTPYLHKGKFSRGLGHFHAVEFKEPAELPDQEYPLHADDRAVDVPFPHRHHDAALGQSCTKKCRRPTSKSTRTTRPRSS